MGLYFKFAAEARKQLADRFPTYAEFQTLKPTERTFEHQPLRLLQPNSNGVVDVTPLNSSLDPAYLKDPRNPRWVAKPTVAYLWARTVRCKGCRASLPLLKTRWLAKKDSNRVVLTMEPNTDRTGVVFGIETNVSQVGGNAAQRREYDRRLGAGTMNRSGAQCPCCPAIMTTEDIRFEAQAGRLGTVMTAVIIDGPTGKEYRLPTSEEREAADISRDELEAPYAKIPYGLPSEPISLQRPSPNTRGASGLPRYGIDNWALTFTDRQKLTIANFLIATASRENAPQASGACLFDEAITAYIAACISRLVDRGSMITTWDKGYQKLRSTFARFVLPMTWDYAECNPINESTGGFSQSIEWVGEVIDHALKAASQSEPVQCINGSAIAESFSQYDVIITDPPYYDAIPYSDIMDFFYVWLRRAMSKAGTSYEKAFSQPLGPKWKKELNDGELVDQPGRFSANGEESKKVYEDGMARVFKKCAGSLVDDGRLVIVFANKNPHAWETLVAALVRAGFLVDGSWPIQTEMGNRTNAVSTASLASSVWLVCKKRPMTARPGWDNSVLMEMRKNIYAQLRTFWDAGIRGPDFVWAATGPALEAFSQHPVVKKADQPVAVMSVSEFLREVRRIVVDFVVGRVLTHGQNGANVSGLDDVTTYYLLHRNDFGLEDAPVGACILYAQACTLSDSQLADRLDLLVRTGGQLFDHENGDADLEDNDQKEDESDAGPVGKGNKVRLKPWNQRKGKTLGYEAPSGRTIPLIDQVHRLMHLWREGEEAKVDDYLDGGGLKRNALFAQLLQALIELAPQNSEERSILESLSNHLVARGGIAAPRQLDMQV